MAVWPGRKPLPLCPFLLSCLMWQTPSMGSLGAHSPGRISSSSSGSRSQAQTNFTPLHFALRSHFTWFSRRCQVLPQIGPLLTSKDFPFPSIDATMGLIFVGAALREPLSRWRREKINTIKPHKEVPICLSGNGKKEAFFMQGLLIFHPKIFFKLSVGKLAATIKRKDCDI